LFGTRAASLAALLPSFVAAHRPIRSPSGAVDQGEDSGRPRFPSPRVLGRGAVLVGRYYSGGNGAKVIAELRPSRLLAHGRESLAFHVAARTSWRAEPSSFFPLRPRSSTVRSRPPCSVPGLGVGSELSRGRSLRPLDPLRFSVHQQLHPRPADLQARHGVRQNRGVPRSRRFFHPLPVRIAGPIAVDTERRTGMAEFPAPHLQPTSARSAAYERRAIQRASRVPANWTLYA